MLRISRWVPLVIIVFGLEPVWAVDPPQGGRLTLVESVVHDDLDSVVKAVISPDGRFVYVPNEDKRAISIFRRD